MTPSQLIDQQITNTPDWRGEKMTIIRQLIHDADPEIVEEWKWETGVFTHGKMVCALGVFKDHIKLNFFKGALISDPLKLFNAGLAKNSRSIDIFENDKMHESGLKELIQKAAQA